MVIVLMFRDCNIKMMQHREQQSCYLDGDTTYSVDSTTVYINRANSIGGGAQIADSYMQP